MTKKKTNNKGKAPQMPNNRTASKIDYVHLENSLYRKELDDWLNAREAMLSKMNPLTYPLQQLYKDSMLDNHLSGIIETQRVLPLLNKTFVIKDKKGNVDEELSQLIEGNWMRKIIREALLSKFYGYSLIYLDNLDADNSKDKIITPIERGRVLPQKNMILRNPYDSNSDGIKYDEFPSYFLYASLGNDIIGLLQSVAPMTIYKRHSWASWDDFEQIFGMPLRIARTSINTIEQYDKIQDWLESMGTASYGIFDKNTDIELVDTKHTDSFHIYLEKINAVNKEMSKCILGETMTTEDGSSQSQAEVHLRILEDVQDADRIEIVSWANDFLIPILRVNNFNIPDGYTFDIIEKADIKPSKKIKIDSILLQNGFNIKPEYIENTYGTPLDEKNPRSNNSEALRFFD